MEERAWVSKKSSVLLADDHPIFLAGLRSLIQTADDLELIGEASTGLAALKLISERRPDVAVVDVSMPGLNGIALSRRVTAEYPSVRIVLLTLHEDRTYVDLALQAGARGYVLKGSAAEALVHAIRAVLTGGLYVDPALISVAFDRSLVQIDRPGIKSIAGLPELTGRETEVLKLAARGFTNKEIARKLNVSMKSVETYKARGAGKLDLKTRADIVRYASINGWFEDI